MKTQLSTLVLLASSALTQSSGTFTLTGSMTTPRFLHTATLLNDGRVLITGGSQSSFNPIVPLTSAEIYDPSTGTFTATGNMTTARQSHTATLLPDGRVLIVGGSGGTGVLGNAEVYDPSTGAFTATGDMVTARDSHTATLLADGRVLIGGGIGSFGYLSSAEIYDPSTRSFATTGGMTDSSEPPDYASVLLPNGSALITRTACAMIDGELYDPRNGTFTQVINSTTRQTGPTTTLLINGSVLIAGGDICDGDGPVANTALFDSSTGNFAANATMTHARESHTATLLSDGTVLMTGGSIGGANSATAEIYDPSVSVFAAIANMTAPRSGHTATLLKNGQVLIVGGITRATQVPIGAVLLSSAELYTSAVTVPAPKLFSISDDGQGAVWHGVTGELVAPTNPATGGEVLSMYTTSLPVGGVIPPQVAVGGSLAEIWYFGAAPGYPGYFQVNFRVPSSAASGPTVPVRLTYIGRPSNEVTIAVQ
jgi:uncharacterized protein (TIGR03437 family)